MKLNEFILYKDKDLEKLISALESTAINISKSIRSGYDSGLTEFTNFSGDVVKYLDLFTSTQFIGALGIPDVATIVGEESARPINVSPKGKYIVAFDPLDGSSNIGNNSTVGSIFSIFLNDSPMQFLRKGKDQIASGYFIYGPALELVIALHDKTHFFAYNPEQKAFVLIKENLKCPPTGKVYSVNYCNEPNWNYHIAGVNKMFIKSGEFTQRYSGSLIADAHRILMKGGIFAYHHDNQNPNGKLRVLYECFPFAKIFENAGGVAINDSGQRILDYCPCQIHEKSSLILGSSELVQRFL